MIEKGCTCKNIFTFPFAQSDVDAIRITYSQKGEVVFEKQLDDCVFSDGEITVYLNQEDTLKFDSFQIIKIQIKVRLKGDLVTKSQIIETLTDEVLSCEVI